MVTKDNKVITKEIRKVRNQLCPPRKAHYSFAKAGLLLHQFRKCCRDAVLRLLASSTGVEESGEGELSMDES